MSVQVLGPLTPMWETRTVFLTHVLSLLSSLPLFFMQMRINFKTFFLKFLKSVHFFLICTLHNLCDDFSHAIAERQRIYQGDEH